MAEQNHVVVHYANGKLLKGTTENFYPNRPSFHVVPHGGGSPVEVRGSDLKALFFVKSLEGTTHQPALTFETSAAANAQGKKIAVLFKDGEIICGYSLAYVPGREGFFMTPAMPGSNNLRIYVVCASAREIKSGPDAESLASRILAEKQAAGTTAAGPGTSGTR